MESDRIFLVIVLTVVIVIGINGLLYLALRRGNEANMIDLTRKALKHSRNPWQEEDQSLQELANLVADLKAREKSIPPDSPVEKESGQPVQGKNNAQ
jgi:hypothetical protein